MQIVTLEINDFKNLEETYPTTFGPHAIELAKISDTSLAFLVPGSITEGRHSLKLGLNSLQKVVEFTVLKIDEIKDADTIIETSLKEAKDMVASEDQIPESENLVKSLRGWIDAFETGLKCMSEAEKKDLVPFINSNFSDDSGNDPNARITWDCFEKNGKVFKYNFKRVVGGVGIIAISAKIASLHPVIGGAGVFSGVINTLPIYKK